MKRLWAPWRMKFVESSSAGCVFCEAQAGSDGPGNLIVRRGSACFVILNRYPYTSGHLMVVARLHVATLEELGPAARAEMMELADRAVRTLQRVYRPAGFNLGMNLGAAAGAGIADHIHLHVVPRWTGDTNFITVLGETRVLPEDLADSYERIRTAWQKEG